MKKVITIFWLGHYFWDSRIFYKQAESLSKEFDVKCIWWFFSNKKWKWTENEIENIWFLWNRFVILIKAWWYGIKNKSDIYIAHDIDSYLVVVWIKFFRWNSKIVFDSHEYYENFDSFDINNLNIVWKASIYLYVYLIKPLTIRLFSWVTVVTEDMKSYYPIKKIEVIYNFPLSEELENIQINNELLKKYKDNFILIFQWWISEPKWILLYLEMLKILKNDIKNIKLLFIWKIIDINFEKIIYKKIKENQIENQVEILWYMNLKDVYKFTKIAKVWLNFLKPSFNHNNAIAIKSLEYLYLDTPIIWTNNNHNFINFIEKNNAWIAINYWNVYEWVDAVKKIYNNYDFYKNNCIKIKNNYIWKNEEIKLLNFYKNI